MKKLLLSLPFFCAAVCAEAQTQYVKLLDAEGNELYSAKTSEVDQIVFEEQVIYVNETFLDGDGGFTATDVSLSGSLSYVWGNSSSYGWKASAYYSSVNNAAESYLVGPAMDFSSAVAPVMTFDHCVGYINSYTLSDYVEVVISTDYDGSNVSSATWTSLNDKITAWPTVAEGKKFSSFISCGEIDLSQFKGNSKVYLAFHYKSTEDVACTYEVKNLVIQEK